MNVAQTLAVETLEMPLTILANAANVSLTFTSLIQLNSSVTLNGTGEELVVNFTSLETITSNGEIVIVNCVGDYTLLVPVLFDIQKGGALTVFNNSNTGPFAAPHVATVDGSLTLDGNAFSSITLGAFVAINQWDRCHIQPTGKRSGLFVPAGDPWKHENSWEQGTPNSQITGARGRLWVTCHCGKCCPSRIAGTCAKEPVR